MTCSRCPSLRIKHLNVSSINWIHGTRLCQGKGLHLRCYQLNEEKDRLKSAMQGVKHVSITTDCWTSRAVESFMTVTVHFITGDWQLQSRVLTTMALRGSHTAEKLSSSLRDVFAAWGILEKVTTCVTDNAANIVSAVGMLKLRHQPCFAHTLNLAVKDSIKKTDDIFTAKNRLKAVVTFFHHSTLGTNHLMGAHKTSHSVFRKLKQDVETRWRWWSPTLSSMTR